MATNLMQLRRLVRSRLGIPLDDDFMPDNVLDDHINLALQTLDAEAHWPWVEGGSALTIYNATPYITPIAGWRATKTIFFGNKELTLVASGDIQRMWDSVGDAPTVWCPLTGTISLRPKPTISYAVTHYYYRTENWLVRDADVPSLPGEYTGAIVAKAAELLAQRESSGSDAQRHAGEYNEWVSRMRKDMRRSTAGVHVRVRPGSWV